jgi:hypothetical protein
MPAAALLSTDRVITVEKKERACPNASDTNHGIVELVFWIDLQAAHVC